MRKPFFYMIGLLIVSGSIFSNYPATAALEANSAARATTAATSQGTAAAAVDTPTIQYDQVFKGAISPKISQISVRFEGKQGDVVWVYTKNDWDDNLPTLRPSQVVTSPDNKPIVDSEYFDADVPSASYNIVSGTNTDVAFNNTVFQLPATGTYTYTVAKTKDADPKVAGNVSFVFHKVPELVVGSPITGTANADSLKNNKWAGAYVLNSPGDFNLDFSTANGNLNLTLNVGKLVQSGAVKVITFAGATTPKTFTPQANPAFLGTTLHLKGDTTPYILTIGNDIQSYDSGFFLKDTDTSTTDFKLSATVLK